jgi:hypothetical protein
MDQGKAVPPLPFLGEGGQGGEGQSPKEGNPAPLENNLLKGVTPRW